MHTFFVELLIGAFLLAVWTDARFPSIAPRTVGRLILHSAMSIIITTFVAGSAISALIATGELGIFAAIFMVALPALTYVLLGGVWALKLTRDHMDGRFR